MPANKKYLTKSPFERFLKITGGIVGGLAVTVTFHTLLTKIFSIDVILPLYTITGWIMWSILLLLAFLMKKGWQVWAVYTILTALFLLPYLLSNS